MWYYPKLISNQVSYTFGLKIEIVQLPQYQCITIDRGSTRGKFLGFFSFADTDFGIQIDNTNSDRRIVFNLKGTKEFGSFVIQAGERVLLKTVISNGRHFHFTSQLSEKGKEVVAANALRSNITYEKSSEICSRLVFDVAIEERKPVLYVAVKEIKKFTVFVHTLTGKKLQFKVSSNDTINKLKRLIQAKERIPIYLQRLLVKSKEWEDWHTLHSCGLQDNGSVHLVLKISGGATSKMPNGDIERGAICFGKKTNQKFIICDDFKQSDIDHVKPFTLELFFKPRMYSLDP